MPDLFFFTKDQNVDNELKKRVTTYYEYVWTRTHGVDPDSLFDGFPIALWGDITLSLYQDIISKVNGSSFNSLLAHA